MNSLHFSHYYICFSAVAGLPAQRSGAQRNAAQHSAALRGSATARGCAAGGHVRRSPGSLRGAVRVGSAAPEARGSRPRGRSSRGGDWRGIKLNPPHPQPVFKNEGAGLTPVLAYKKNVRRVDVNQSYGGGSCGGGCVGEGGFGRGGGGATEGSTFRSARPA